MEVVHEELSDHDEVHSDDGVSDSVTRVLLQVRVLQSLFLCQVAANHVKDCDKGRHYHQNDVHTKKLYARLKHTRAGSCSCPVWIVCRGIDSEPQKLCI